MPIPLQVGTLFELHTIFESGQVWANLDKIKAVTSTPEAATMRVHPSFNVSQLKPWCFVLEIQLLQDFYRDHPETPGGTVGGVR